MPYISRNLPYSQSVAFVSLLYDFLLVQLLHEQFRNSHTIAYAIVHNSPTIRYNSAVMTARAK